MRRLKLHPDFLAAFETSAITRVKLAYLAGFSTPSIMARSLAGGRLRKPGVIPTPALVLRLNALRDAIAYDGPIFLDGQP